MKMLSLFFFFENAYFTLSPSASSSIYNIDIVINTPTTMNNPFEAPSEPKNQYFTVFLSQFLWTKINIYFTFSPYSSKKLKILILKCLWFIGHWSLRFLVGHFCLRFWVLGKKLCVLNKLSHWLKLSNQFFSQICSSRRLTGKSLAIDNLHVSGLAVDDLHGSLLVNANVSFAVDF